MRISAHDSVLVVVAHPDDDILGFGGTAYMLGMQGISVQACILSGGVSARQRRPSDKNLHSDMLRASERVAMQAPIVGDFENIQMNTVPHLELVRFVENAMRQTQANIIFTMDTSDLNDDHRQVSRAAQAAARLHQRGGLVPPLKAFAYMETLSSTDWQIGGDAKAFSPNLFASVSEEGLSAKISALKAYRGVMRPFPHPRSEEAIRGLAYTRGAQSGVGLAEAFHVSHILMEY